MEEGFLHEIELSSLITTTLYLIPYPHGMPQTNTILGVGQPIREKNPSVRRISHISSKIDSIRIQFEAGLK